MLKMVVEYRPAKTSAEITIAELEYIAKLNPNWALPVSNGVVWLAKEED